MRAKDCSADNPLKAFSGIIEIKPHERSKFSKVSKSTKTPEGTMVNLLELSERVFIDVNPAKAPGSMDESSVPNILSVIKEVKLAKTVLGSDLTGLEKASSVLKEGRLTKTYEGIMVSEQL